MTYYDLLEVSESASIEIIRVAYRSLMKKYHPDIYDGDPQFAHESAKKLNEAYEVLSDPNKREKYDNQLAAQFIQQEVKGIERIILSWKTPNTNTSPYSIASNAITPENVGQYINLFRIANGTLKNCHLPLSVRNMMRTHLYNTAYGGMVYLHNERDKTAHALTIARALSDEFGDIPEIKEEISSDIALLMRQLAQQRNSNKAPYSSSVQNDTSRKGLNHSYIVLACIFLIALIPALYQILFDSSSSSSVQTSGTSSTFSASATTSNLTPVIEPKSGAILSGDIYSNGSELTITTPSSSSCVVKLKNTSGSTRISFYVRAGDTVTVVVPAENLYIYFATGKTWYGKKQLFGENTYYSKDDDLLDFSNYTWEYTLKPVTNGNFTQTPIDSSEF